MVNVELPGTEVRCAQSGRRPLADAHHWLDMAPSRSNIGTRLANLVPDSAVAAFITEAELARAQSFAQGLGAFAVAVQAFDVEHLPERIQWARDVLAGVTTTS